MALFKIFKGLDADLSQNKPNTNEGYCYFTTDTGKMYIDIQNGTNTASNSQYRVCLNAEKADVATRAINADSATKATQDGDGKVISSTYLKLSGGTMTGDLLITNGSHYKLKIPAKKESTGGWARSILRLYDNADTGFVNFGAYGNGISDIYLYLGYGMSYDSDINLRIYPDGTVKAKSFSGNASTATALATARTIRTNLASTSTASFDGSADITPGVTGTLPVANGGTGKTSFSDGYLILGNGTSALKMTNIHVNYSPGTTTTTGSEELVIGNSLVSNTTGNTQGRLALYSAKNAGVYLIAAEATSWSYTNILPASNGTLLNTTNYSSYALPLSGGTMTGNILFKGKGIKVEAPDLDVPIWTVYSSTEGSYGFRLQYDGTGTGNNNSLSLIADNQSGDEVRAYKILQDGTVSFTNTIDGNAATATVLQNSRNLKIGNTSKAFNGSSNLTWTDNEIGFLNLVTRGTELADAADLNSVDFGNFFANNSTKSATLINAPITTAGFRLFSVRGYNSTSSAYWWQFATSSGRSIYQRYKGSGDWSEWGTVVLNPSQKQLGSATQPVYIGASGTAIACTAYSGLLTAFTSATNTLTLTVGGTTKTAAIVNSISNTWANGTTAGPTLKTTVNGVAGTAVAIPAASASYSGIVTTGTQHFAGQKFFNTAPVVYNHDTSPALYFYPKQAKRTQGSVQCYYANTNGIGTSNRMQIVEWSYNSTTAAANNYYEIYNFPAVTADRTSNATYEIFTSKSYGTLDGRYLKLSGGTVTGNLSVCSNVQFRKAESVTSGTTAGTRNSLLIYGTTYGNDSAYLKAAGKLSYGDPGPQIVFNTSNSLTSGQIAALIFTDHDTIATGCSLSLVSNQTSCTFIAPKVKGAVWNDYAEYRNQKEEIKPGYCVASTNDGKVYKTIEMYQACDGIVSDTFGFDIGQTLDCKTPLAVAGRVLAYCAGNRYDYNAGDTVCAGPGGLVYKMTREEIKEYPDRIVGIVSEIPEYEIWGTGEVEVNGRIWIKVK